MIERAAAASTHAPSAAHAPAETSSQPVFDRFARWTERQVGSPYTFSIAAGVIVLWAAVGPLCGWSDTWQLVINTGTTIVTFLMVFIIQRTQSRDTRALHLKLDELIRVNKSARNSLLNLEEMSEPEIDQVKDAFCRLVGNPKPARNEDTVPSL